MWLIKQALDLVDELYVVVGINPTKKYTFNEYQRRTMIEEVIYAELGEEAYDKIDVELHDGLLVHKAADIGARYIIRGIRNLADFNYEQQIQQVNKRIDPNVDTVFLIPPPEFMEVSSSTVKSLVGFRGWEDIVSQYVNPIVVKELQAKQ
jgi:pantetheine-phosphate adenylyltransferase